MNTSAYKKLVSFLPPHLLEFALQDEDTRLDIIEHKLDTYEIETLVWLNYDLERRQTKKKITMSLPESTLWGIKLKAAENGMPYQTFINSILHQYITGKIQ